MKTRNPLLGISFIALLLSVAPVCADIVDTGDVQVIGNDLYIGNTAFGQRVITDTTDSKSITRLGNAAGIRGELTVRTTAGVPQGRFTTNSLEIGTLGEGNVSLFGYLTNITVTGINPLLSVGAHGQGTLYIDTIARLSVSAGNGLNARSFIAQYPGSQGTVQVQVEGTYNAGNVLRVGLDENDNLGGIGLLHLTGPFATANADSIKIGPTGTIRAVDESRIQGEVVNQGVLTGGSRIQGNVTNLGRVDQSEFISLITANNYTQQASAMYRSAIDPADFYRSVSQLQITNGSLDGSVEVVFLTPPQGNAVYDLILASAGITFAPSLSISFAGLPSEFTATPVFTSNGLSIAVNRTVPLTADLSASLSDSPDPVSRNKQLVYQSMVRNNGPEAAENVVYLLTLPTGVSFNSATTSQGTCTGGAAVTCNLRFLSVGASANVAVTVTVLQGKEITATANVTTSSNDPNLSNNSSSQTTKVRGGKR
jgi:uncharacterized repeat protein (TIGR01451 family)